MANFNVEFSSCNLDATFSETIVLNQYNDIEPYTGEYDVVPDLTSQMLFTAGKRMIRNVKVAPIPNNYGLVTYHQDRTITIS